MKTSDFLEFNSRTVRMKLDKAYFDKLNFKLGKDIKNCVIELVKKEISSSCDRNKDINYDDLEKITDKVFSSFFTNNILNIDFLCKIIEENFEFTDNYYDSLISLNKLAYIIEKAGIYLSEKYIFELMERSAVLRENVQTIVVNKKEDIQNGKLNNIIKNDIMLIIINVYLSMYSFNNSVKSDDIKYSSKTIKKQDKNIKEPSSKKRSKKDDSFKIVSELLCDYDYSSYVSFINSFSPLTFEEEIDLGKKIRKGDLKARDLLVYHNLKLVAIITQKYITSGVELLDLISEGNIGLIKALINDIDVITSDIDRVLYELKYLGYSNIIVDTPYFGVESIETNQYGTTYIKLYHISVGESMLFKIDKKWYNQFTQEYGGKLEQGDILDITVDEKPKRRKIDNEWVEVGIELVITAFCRK